MFTPDWLTRFQQRLNADPEMAVIGGWFTTAFSLTCGDTRCVLRFERGRLVEFDPAAALERRCAFGFRASAEIWDRFFARATRAALSRLLRDADAGARLRAGGRFARRHAARARAAPGDERDAHRPAVMTDPVVDLGARCARRHLRRPCRSSRSSAAISTCEIDGVDYRIFFEEAGAGIPLLCLHTAGADSRQYRHLLNDRAVTNRYRVIAFDLPYHGRSNPPDGWWLGDSC